VGDAPLKDGGVRDGAALRALELRIARRKDVYESGGLALGDGSYDRD